MSIARIGAIVRADFLIRFRRVSTLIAFLVLSALAYLWVPDPATGRALLQIDGKRALYNSAAIGVGTASLATIFIGLAGYYVISNALRHDIRSRCGYILASTPMRSMDYIAGKFAGNVLFLTTFMGGFMLTSMAMLLIRAEARLEPFVFLKQYLLMVPPAIVFVSVLAILFESIPWLSGRFGDVVYFFFWAASLGIVASRIEDGVGGTLLRCFDFSGMAFLITQLKATATTTHISIGSSSFDASKGLFIYQGLTTANGWLVPRIGSLLLPLPLLLIARLFFHRFDPARVRASATKGKANLLTFVSRLFKPITEAAFLIGGRGGTSLLAAARTDALLSLTSLPIAVAAIAGIAIATIAGAEPRKLLPFTFVAIAITIADVASREKRSGMTGLTFAAPLLKERFVLWKLGSTILLGAAFLAAPAIRIGSANPRALVPLLVGLFFIAATATTLGITTSNPKTFLLLFLSFWYVVVNDRGANPSLDFAGIYGTGGPAVIAMYTSLAVGSLIAAEGWHRWELRRRW